MSMADMTDMPKRQPRGLRRRWRIFARRVASYMPQGLYGRSLIIIIAPMILLQTVVAAVFMERHFQQVTERLSGTLVGNLAAIVSVIENYPQDDEYATVTRIARRDFGLNIDVLEGTNLPSPRPKPFFSILDRTLSRSIVDVIDKPFWIDTVGRSKILEIRIKLGDDVLRVFAPRSSAYASNTHIFMIWMVGAAIVLLTIAILFLRNQIKPIQRLAEEAESFGKGRPSDEAFRPGGAREVRQAAHSFAEMRDRIERSMEQRTAMLAGVSHDMKTVLTRFRLQLAFAPPGAERDAMEADTVEMQKMLDAYLDFAKGDGAEIAADLDLSELVQRFEAEAKLKDRNFEASIEGEPIIHVRPGAFRRLLSNLVSNAFRYGENVGLHIARRDGWLTIDVDDDGPGVPEKLRDDVFRPFFRLDEARNLDDTGNGLGLSIARDIARSHGGDIRLRDAPSGGLRACVRIPA